MQQGSAMKQHVRLNIHTAGSTGPPSPFFHLQRHLTQFSPLPLNTFLHGMKKTGQNITSARFSQPPGANAGGMRLSAFRRKPVKGSCEPRRRRVHEPRQCACAIPACRPPYPGWGTGPPRKSWPPGLPPGTPIQ